MSKKTVISGAICHYCGAPAVSEDHLPPSCIFDAPKPSNRIKVPSCKKHNEDQSIDDEYFRCFVTTASAESSIAKSLFLDKVVRGLERSNLFYEIWDSRRQVELRSKAGLFVGTAPALEFKRDRIQSVISRMTRGFYFHFFGERLPGNSVVMDYRLNPSLDDVEKHLIVQLPLHKIGSGEFSFRFIRGEDDPYSSIWLFMFYERTLIVSLTDK